MLYKAWLEEANNIRCQNNNKGRLLVEIKTKKIGEFRNSFIFWGKSSFK